MKWIGSPRGLFLLGFIVLAATNIAVLAGVAYNRSGTPESLTTLSERELPLPYSRDEEDSGLTLPVKWRVLGPDEDDEPYHKWGYPAWFTADKLAALGFQIDDQPGADTDRGRAGTPLPKEVFIVLENDGPAYREALRRAEKTLAYAEDRLRAGRTDTQTQEAAASAAKHLERERRTASRLFAVDAGLDPAGLRETYPDRARFVIARALVRPVYDDRKDRRRVQGDIQGLSVASIHVPLAHRQLLDALMAKGGSRKEAPEPPRYAIKLAYGRRFEPWIVAVTPGASPSP